MAYPWLTTEGTHIVTGPAEVSTWWTFGGRAVNATLVAALQARLAVRITHDNLAVMIESSSTPETIQAAIADVLAGRGAALLPGIDPDAVAGLKFADCMPREMAIAMLQRRAADQTALRKVLAEPVRSVVHN